MSRLEEIIKRLADAREWARSCGDREGSFQEGMYSQKELPGDLDYLISMAKE